MEQYRLILPTDLTIINVEDYKQEVLSILSVHPAFIIDDSQVQKVDTIGVQFVLSLIKLFQANNKEIQWEHHCKLLKETVVQLGLSDSEYFSYIFDSK